MIERFPTSAEPAFDPDEVCQRCRVDSDSDRAEVERLARAAAIEFESYANIALLEQTIRYTLLGVLDDPSSFALPVGPVPEGADPTVWVNGVEADGFALRSGLRPVLAKLTDEETPSIAPEDVLVIEYPAGFGSSAADIPADISTAIADQAAAWFDNRGIISGLGMSAHMARIAARYRVVVL